MVRPTPSTSSIIAACASATLVVTAVIAAAPAVPAATFTATDGASRVTISTPIAAPATGACTKVPYAYLVAGDAASATATIVDAAGALVARSSELLPGEGTDDLNVCGANLSGRSSPYRLQLRITYADASRGPVTVAAPATFGFAPRTVTCRKVTRPHRGRVQVFTTRTCPRGWIPARRATSTR